MPRYLDVAVVQIQSYLTRAPNLKGRRGASTMVSNASAALRQHLPDDFTVNDEAGLVDGVVSLRAADHVSENRTKQVGGELCAALRAALPAAALRAEGWRGNGYRHARATADPEWTVRWSPAVPEWPAAKPCDWCRRWPALDQPHRPVGATGSAEESDNVEHYCRDCTLRLPASGASTVTGRPPGPERQLLERLPGNTVPNTMDALAALGPMPRDATHLATICADGNRIGEYMAASGHAPDLAARISAATWAAVDAVANARTVPGAQLALIPHLIGGDDVLLTVPAHDAWPAVRALLGGFGGDLPRPGRGIGSPTLSAGIVIHHHKEPLADVVELGHALLRRAKDDHPGQPALAWHSTTHDGAEPGPRPAIPLAELQNRHNDLAALAALPGSARQQLARLCRERHTDPDALARHLTRLHLDVVAPFTPDGIDLEDALSMIRWWTS